MEGFPIELARSILNMEMEKENILKKDQKSRRLCYCRKQILLNFVSVCQLFFIRFSSKVLKFSEDHNIEKSTTTDLREWYESSIYTKQFNDPELSSKMILIFKLLQDSLDASFFDDFEIKYKEAISHIDEPEFREMLSALYDDMNEWMQNYLLNILTLKIDCAKLSPELTTDFGILDNSTLCNEHGCVRCDTDDCPAMVIGHDHYYSEEEIHLYYGEDFDDTDFLTKYFDIMVKYHTNPKNIKIIFDFMLYTAPFQMTPKQKAYIEMAKDKFKTVQVINYKALKG